MATRHTRQATANRKTEVYTTSILANEAVFAVARTMTVTTP